MNNMKKSITLVGLLALLFTISSFTSNPASVQDGGDDIIGIWEPSNGKARVKIEKIGSKYYGKIVWLREPIDPATSKPKVDKNNEDEKMRNVPLRGYRMLKDFTYDESSKEWTDGTIYDPESGSLYNCVITMKDDVLNIRGYVGVKALGRTDTWKRLKLKKKN
jgi:uncharacterized protein (DUF2147 family)